MNINSMMQKSIILSALAAVILNLSASGAVSFSDCLDNCMCCCKGGHTAEVIYTECCSSKAVVISNSCCQTEHSHEAHLSVFKYNFRSVICDLNEFAFNKHILAEISGVNCADQKSPVDIVYFIFKPPIA